MPPIGAHAQTDFGASFGAPTAERLGYAGGAFTRGIGGSSKREGQESRVFRKILFVCVGNVCRSPTAEVVMRQLHGRGDIEVGSAGLGALAGHPIDPTAQQILLEHGLDGSAHRARQVDGRLLVRSDLILVMEHRHLFEISRDVPQVSGKTFLLGKWRNEREIGDPYRQQRPAFEHVYGLIEDCVASWVPHIGRR